MRLPEPGGHMKIAQRDSACRGIRFSVSKDTGDEIARAYLYIMTNDLHAAPFGLMEDVFVAESQRGTAIGTTLVREVVSAAQKAGCYKLIATSRTSRPKVHELYEQLGFSRRGVEFRIDFAG
jgi:GNAT superfamily N-acetyltransferase